MEQRRIAVVHGDARAAIMKNHINLNLLPEVLHKAFAAFFEAFLDALFPPLDGLRICEINQSGDAPISGEPKCKALLMPAL